MYRLRLSAPGVGTLLFHFCSKGKVPAFLGSSFAFLGGFATISKLNTGAFANISNAEKLSYACGGILVAGLLYLVLALIIRLIGVKKVMRFLPPVVTGPIIICIRTESGRLRCQQCLHKLAACLYRACNHRCFQYLGQGHV